MSLGGSKEGDDRRADAKSHIINMLPPPQPLAADDIATKAADLAASRSQAALREELSDAKEDLAAAAATQQATEVSAIDSKRQLSDIQALAEKLYSDITTLKKERQAAHDRVESLCRQLQSAQAEVAGCSAAAGHRAAQLASQASAADSCTAELTARVAALQQEHAQAMAAAQDELVACRNAGMKVSHGTLVASVLQQ